MRVSNLRLGQSIFGYQVLTLKNAPGKQVSLHETGSRNPPTDNLHQTQHPDTQDRYMDTDRHDTMPDESDIAARHSEAQVDSRASPVFAIFASRNRIT